MHRLVLANKVAEIRKSDLAQGRRQETQRLVVSFFHATEAHLRALELMLMNSSANQAPLVFKDAETQEWIVVPSSCRIHRVENLECDRQVFHQIARLRFDLTMECIPT